MKINDIKLLEQLYKRHGRHNLLNEIAVADPHANAPRVYVSTYAKYNDGNLNGEWVELDDFSDYDDFIEYCTELHSDERHPELMFQDWENIPDEFISESHLSEDFWDLLEMYNEYDQTFINDLIDHIGSSDIDEIRDTIERLYIIYTDDVTYALETFLEDTGDLDDPDFCEKYFDYDEFGRALDNDGFIESEIEDIDDEDERDARYEELSSMSYSDLAQYYIDMCGSLSDAVPEKDLRKYVDFDQIAREYDYFESEINGSPVVSLVL